MIKIMLSLYRQLPWFKGKLTIGRMLFGSLLQKEQPIELLAHSNIRYKIPNTMENIGIELLINGIYEQDIVRFLRKEVQDGDVFFDIGANIGSIGLPVLKHKKNISYYGFEASKSTFDFLEYNFRVNKIENYHIYNNLIHADDGREFKFFEAELYGKSSLASTYSDHFITIQSVSLDSFCNKNNIPFVDFMKVDVQGFELNVFEGMQQMLKEKRIKSVLFEFEDWAEREAGINIGAAQEFIEGCGYRLYDLSGKRLDKILRAGSNMIWAKNN